MCFTFADNYLESYTFYKLLNSTPHSHSSLSLSSDSHNTQRCGVHAFSFSHSWLCSSSPHSLEPAPNPAKLMKTCHPSKNWRAKANTPSLLLRIISKTSFMRRRRMTMSSWNIPMPIPMNGTTRIRTGIVLLGEVYVVV